MQNILVTGAGGFIGSYLVEELLAEGFHVKGFVHYNSRNNWGKIEELRGERMRDLEVISGDIRDFDSVYKAMHGCDTVFHLAALIGIPYSYISPLAYIRTNIEGSYNVLQAAKEQGVNQLLMTSTSETYGTAQFVPINEDHPLVGQSPYSATKIAADQLAISYYRSFSLPVKIVRPFNTFGPRQSARAIIPAVIIQILEGKNVIQLGNLHPTRDLCYVKDTVKGFLAVAKSELLTGHTVNIGTDSEISIGDLALKIAGLMGADIKIKGDEKRVRTKDSEVERLRCDNTKLTSVTGWKPTHSLEEGLLETIAYIKNHLGEYKSEIYNV